MANTAVISLATRQQVMLERLKSGDVKKLAAFMTEAAAAIRAQLAGENLTDFSRARAERQLAVLVQDIRAIYQQAGAQITQDMQEIAEYAAGAEARALSSVLADDFEAVAPSARQVMAAAIARPITVGKTAVMLETFVDGWSVRAVESVENAVRLGYMQGKTNQEIIRQVVGTKANNYRDGIVDVTYRNAETVVRTAVQHVAQVAREEMYLANSDIVAQYEWVSTLDDRTTAVCQSLDGRVFDIGKGPLPPIHPNCRSSTAPLIKNRALRTSLREGATRSSVDGPVSANLTYFEWLKTQPVEFQDLAIGPQRAKLLRDGGLSAQRFQELQLNKNFEPLTLEEMRRLEPVAFERAGL